MPTKFIQATGRRKTAIARVIMKEGTGLIQVNNRELLTYFGRKNLVTHLRRPLAISNAEESFDIKINATGGGLSGQSGACSLGIARALVAWNEENRKELRSAGLLTRDSRMVQRKMYGHKKARKSFQFSKR